MLNGIAEIIFLAVIAGALVVQLIKILGGKKFDPDEGVKTELRARGDAMREALEAEAEESRSGGQAARAYTEEEEKFAEQMAAARKYDPDFTLEGFRKGAERAFALVVSAYAKGDVETLKSLCSVHIFEAFTSAMGERATAGLVSEVTVVKVSVAECLSFKLEKAKAEITLRFLSEQMTCMKDRDGLIAEGSSPRIVRQEDAWTFEKNMRDANPNWRLCRTGAALAQAALAPLTEPGHA